MICAVIASSSSSPAIIAAPAASKSSMAISSARPRIPFSHEVPSSFSSRKLLIYPTPFSLESQPGSEADRHDAISLPDEDEKQSTWARTLKVGFYFATWWASNVVFDIYNKKLLYAFPYPWLTSTLSLAAGFMGAMISNLAFVFSSIFSKRGMSGKSVSWMNYYACLSMLSLLIRTPFAIAVEGPQVWAEGWQKAISQIGPHFVWWVAAQSVFYHLWNQVSYMALEESFALTFNIGNTMKRISVIVSSIIILHTSIQPINALGAAIAILVAFLYSQVAAVLEC
ncbi:hypothetical protein ZIOFF_033947 [Zingiber officinale]|uniref:Sugar phosphate transporter domain-containing protein n=1 Tax=Zingiber officinale TaxID=94328 RepID=A0A8J5GXQ6_ZINOF|nr:hypothetical protein ZIOFF_033947 [Zingiber officinale]